jgi:CubicO group peptidase (beta-lactamase class C family)
MAISQGECDPAFAGVRAVFEANLADGHDLGAAVAVVVDGRPVVDLWGGVADRKTGRAWARDTACVTFSCTKAVTATAALLLAERGVVSLDAPVTTWWPEFAAHGKDSVTGEMLLTHRAGLPAFARPIGVDEAADPVAMADQLAGQAPEWEPGTDHGYHALTFGWLVGELVRRHTGRSVGDFVRREIDPELTIGVPAERIEGLARIASAPSGPDGDPGDPGVRRPDAADDLVAVAHVLAAMRDAGSPLRRSTENPAGSFNSPAVLTAGWPAAGLVCTARALAGFYARLVAGDVLRPDTLADAIRERVRGPDRTLVFESAFGLGYMRPAQNMLLPPAARSSAFGHPGISGALGIGDAERGVGFAYIPNLSRPAVHDGRAYRLVHAVYDALDRR